MGRRVQRNLSCTRRNHRQENQEQMSSTCMFNARARIKTGWTESKGGEPIYSGPGCQNDPMRPLAEFTIPTARPTSPPGWLSSSISWDWSPESTATSAVESGTGNKGLQETVGELAGVGFLDLWTSSSSGIGIGIGMGDLLYFDGRLCMGVGTTVLVVGWGWGCS